MVDADGEHEVVLGALDGQDLGGGVDVAGDHMPADLLTLNEAALEVDQVALLTLGEGRDVDGLHHDVEDEAVVVEGRDGEADAVYADAGTDLDALDEVVGHRDLEGGEAGLALEALDGKRALDDAAVHGISSGRWAAAANTPCRKRTYVGMVLRSTRRGQEMTRRRVTHRHGRGGGGVP